MRSVNYVQRVSLDFSGTLFPHAICLGDADNDSVSNMTFFISDESVYCLWIIMITVTPTAEIKCVYFEQRKQTNLDNDAYAKMICFGVKLWYCNTLNALLT